MKRIDGIEVKVKLKEEKDYLTEYDDSVSLVDLTRHGYPYLDSRLIATKSHQPFEIAVNVRERFRMYTATMLCVAINYVHPTANQIYHQCWAIPLHRHDVAASYRFDAMVLWESPELDPQSLPLTMPCQTACEERVKLGGDWLEGGMAAREGFIVVDVMRGNMCDRQPGPEHEEAREMWDPPQVPNFAAKVPTVIRSEWFRKLKSENGDVMTAVFVNVGNLTVSDDAVAAGEWWRTTPSSSWIASSNGESSTRFTGDDDDDDDSHISSAYLDHVTKPPPQSNRPQPDQYGRSAYGHTPALLDHIRVKSEPLPENIIAIDDDDDNDPAAPVAAVHTPPAPAPPDEGGNSLKRDWEEDPDGREVPVDTAESARAKQRARLMLELEEVDIEERRIDVQERRFQVKKQLLDLEG